MLLEFYSSCVFFVVARTRFFSFSLFLFLFFCQLFSHLPIFQQWFFIFFTLCICAVLLFISFRYAFFSHFEYVVCIYIQFVLCFASLVSCSQFHYLVVFIQFVHKSSRWFFFCSSSSNNNSKIRRVATNLCIWRYMHRWRCAIFRVFILLRCYLLILY